MSSSPTILPGRPETLTLDEEEKLRQLWQRIFQVFGRQDSDARSEDTAATTPPTTAVPPASTPLVTSSEADEKAGRKKRVPFFTRRGRKESDPQEAVSARAAGNRVANGTSTSAVNGNRTLSDNDDKYGQVKALQDILTNQDPQVIRDTLWAMVKHDNPDALVLRFLRARKWDIDKALAMLVATMNWRANEMRVDNDIMKYGEGGAAAAAARENADDPVAQRLGRDFMSQIRMGKSFLRGIDTKGRPLCVVRVRLHRQGEHCEESLERYTVYLIETARMILKPPIDTATIVFDMTGFSLANMDYTPVKFMIKCFEANYPESLGAVIVHKAPWVFQGIWKIIRGWLDPVVASKIFFTDDLKGLEEFIPRSRVLKELGGDEDWEYRYVEPVDGENDRMKDTITRNKLLADRDQMYADYEAKTAQWIQTPTGDEGSRIKAERRDIAAKLRENYWALDPYIRARSLYDRIGVLRTDGTLDYYPDRQPEPKTNGVNGDVD